MFQTIDCLGGRLGGAQGRKIRPFLAAGCLYLLSIQAAVVGSGVSRLSDGNLDFRHLYTAGCMVRLGHGHEIYDYERTKILQKELVGPKVITAVFNHLAFEALLFVPFSLLSFRSAYLLWMGVNVFLLVFCFGLLQNHYGPLRSIWSPLPTVLFVSFFPFAFALIEGQDSIVLTTLLICAIVATKKGRDYLAGAILAAGLFKFQFILPIVGLATVWRRWKIALGFLAGMLFVLFASLATIGVSSVRIYLRYLLAMSSTNQQVYVQPAYIANLRGCFVGTAEPLLGHGAAQVLTIAASVVVFVWACRQKASISVAMMTSVLVSYHCLPHDLSLLIIPLILAPYQQHFTGRAWLSAAMLFVAPGVAFAWGIPFWVVAIPMLIFLFQIRGKDTPLLPLVIGEAH